MNSGEDWVYNIGLPKSHDPLSNQRGLAAAKGTGDPHLGLIPRSCMWNECVTRQEMAWSRNWNSSSKGLKRDGCHGTNIQETCSRRMVSLRTA